MWNKVILCYKLLLLLVNLCYGLDNSKQQRYTSNTDFLLHETGSHVDSIKKQYESLSNSGKRDYVAQYPALKSPLISSTTVKPVDNQSFSTTVQTSKKRDYVASQFPALKPQRQDSTGRVKDLVNFYDSKSGNHFQNVPSYSSILQGSGGVVKSESTTPSTTNNFKHPTTQRTPTSPSRSNLNTSVTLRSNKNKPNDPSSHATFTTPKTSTKPFIRPIKPTTGNSLPAATRPASVVLPSSINNNRNINQVQAVSDTDIQTLTEELLRKDTNNAAKFITLNYQEKTTSYSTEDKAPNPLLNVVGDAWNIPTIQKFLPLLDNYERDTLINEYITPQERNEENAFMDAIMSTNVIRHLMNFLKDKGFVSPDPRQQRDFLKQLWFSLYSRGKGKLSSSGFEHVFVSELKNGEISGLHNWIYFSKEETANRVNYLGYLKYVQLTDGCVVMKLHFNQQGIDKPVDSMFIGTSPELEIALYTLCFVTRADNDCKIKLANKDVKIITHTFRYRSKNMIGSAYPQI